MGRTLPSVTQVFHMEEDALRRFRRAMRRRDQLALEEMFDQVQQHLAAAAYAAHTLPMEIFLLCMLLEEHKQVQLLKAQVATLLNPGGLPDPPPGSLFEFGEQENDQPDSGADGDTPEY